MIRTPLSRDRLRQVVQDLAADGKRWPRLVRYDAQRRWYRRLAWDDDHEVWLLSWLPGQHTGFHDHGGSAGAFAVACGALRERTAPGGRPGAAGVTVAQGQVRSFGPWHVHDVTNASALPAVSVHAYSPPLMSMRRFEFGPAGAMRITMEAAGRW